MICVYTKIDEKLACWEVDTTDPIVAIETVPAELPPDWSKPVLARIK